jgi:4-diphosphocytidyl-2-C-methyl-D-erythritol kinase
MRSLSLRAHAKINIFLKVGPKRKDGYHSLTTEFQEIDLFDQLTFRRLEAPLIQLTVDGADLPTGSDNLIVRALSALRAAMKTRYGLHVHLKKNIPIGAGLGGGSSDAAAALWGGWLVWRGRPLSSYRRKVPSVLKRIAPTLGADVPFFLNGGRALGKGIGERLTRLKPNPIRWLIVVYPRVHVSTPKAYGWLDDARKKSSSPQESLVNDFERVVSKKVPAIGSVIRHLKSLGCQTVMLSGSGSAVVGFSRSRGHVERVRRKLPLKKWDVWAVRTKN